MFKSYKYRLYPTDAQKRSMDTQMNLCRFIYNLALETKIQAYQRGGISLSAYDLSGQLTELKKEYTWLNEGIRDSLGKSIQNMEDAYKKLFSGNGFPKFKKKTDCQSFTVKGNTNIKKGKLFITKFREGISIKYTREIPYRIRRATISKTPTGKYFVSCLFETGEPAPAKQNISENTSIGVDLGIKTLVVLSNGSKTNSPKFFQKHYSKLSFLQRIWSKRKGKRTKHKICLLHEKISNQRADFLHKLSSNLINNHDTICIENLNVAGMVKNRNLSKFISDSGWGQLVDQLKYKSEWYGKNLLIIGRFEPSSKTCSDCGAINHDLKLKDREWACAGCGSVHDRDVNAAINIKNFALKILCREPIQKNQEELPALMGSIDS